MMSLGPVTTMSGKIDSLFWFLVLVCGSVGLLIIILMLVFSFQYRRRQGYEPVPHVIRRPAVIETIWIGLPLAMFMVLFVWGAKLYFEQMRVPGPGLQIYCVGKQWMWKFQHPEGPREINELHIPIGQMVQVTLISQDVIHSFFIPAFHVKMDVLPERYTNVWFKVLRAGRYHLFCSQYCGTGHSRMTGTIVAMRADDYKAWLTQARVQDMARAGERLFENHACNQCHVRGALAAAPRLDGVFGTEVALTGGQTVIADESYIRESILYPTRKVVNGFPNVMPAFQGQLSEEEVFELVAYVRSLGSNAGGPRREDADGK